MNELRDQPFALIGVNSANHEPAALKEVMRKEQLNWRSFADQGSISRAWNNPPTPTFYIIDPAGTIRHKWTGSPGAPAIDAALESLLRAAP